MLLSKTVKVKWINPKRKWYELKGYEWTGLHTEFEVKVEDLPNESAAKLKVRCDNCGEEMNISWYSYKRYVKNDGRYFCKKCSNTINKKEKELKTKLEKSKSFEQWCTENNKQDILERWDYELNNYKPNEVCYGSSKKFYFKCPKEIHESELKDIHNFINGKEGSLGCKTCNSFAQWGIDNICSDFLEKYWDWDENNKNEVNPWKIAKTWHGKIYIKCQDRKYHGSYDIKCDQFYRGRRCKYCNCHNKKTKIYKEDSFAQWGIDSLGEDFLVKYWDYEKNEVNPWKISPHANKPKIWIKCQDNYHHESYLITCNNFCNGQRCGYCSGKKVHKYDSLGWLYPEVLDIWSDKNRKAPYEYLPNSGVKVWWKCTHGKHKDYQRRISDAKRYDFRCPECEYSKGETRISEYLIDNKISYVPQKVFKGLTGLKNGLLSYDFYLYDYDLLIEFQGEQHEKYIPGFHENKKVFEKQQEHDRRKHEYAKDHNIRLLEIWYWDFGNIEQILEKELKEINEYVNL